MVLAMDRQINIIADAERHIAGAGEIGTYSEAITGGGHAIAVHGIDQDNLGVGWILGVEASRHFGDKSESCLFLLHCERERTLLSQRSSRHGHSHVISSCRGSRVLLMT